MTRNVDVSGDSPKHGSAPSFPFRISTTGFSEVPVIVMGMPNTPKGGKPSRKRGFSRPSERGPF